MQISFPTWEHEIGWDDDDVGATITEQIKAWMSGMPHSSELHILRFLADFAIEKIQLQLSCDATEKLTELQYMPDHWEHLRPSLPCYVPSPAWRPEKHLA